MFDRSEGWVTTSPFLYQASYVDGLSIEIQVNPEFTFISTYAQDNPTREDIAESFLPYVALRYRRDRISDELASTFETTIPKRILFFDSVVRDMYPLE